VGQAVVLVVVVVVLVVFVVVVVVECYLIGLPKAPPGYRWVGPFGCHLSPVVDGFLIRLPKALAGDRWVGPCCYCGSGGGGVVVVVVVVVVCLCHLSRSCWMLCDPPSQDFFGGIGRSAFGLHCAAVVGWVLIHGLL
jgi:hypothetical protein